MSLRKKSTLLFAAAATAIVFVGAAAFACTNLATLNLSSTAGKPGDVVTVTGSSLAVGRGDAPTFPVQLRWNGVDGMVLAPYSAPLEGQAPPPEGRIEVMPRASRTERCAGVRGSGISSRPLVVRARW